MKKLFLTFMLLLITSFFYIGECMSNIKLDSAKTVEKPILIIQKPSSTTFCGGEELKLKYTTTGNYPLDNVFTFYFVYTINTANSPIITKYELGKSKLLSEEVSLKIPTDILSVHYQLEVSSSNPNLSTIYEDLIFRVLQKPEVTISGNTATNLGISTLLNVIRNFGSRCQYVLSDSTRGEIVYDKTFIGINPSKTTTYKILSVFNECGVGKSSGSATVIVNPVSEKKIEIEFYEFNPAFSERYPSICSGATYAIGYKTTGNFSVTNKFTVQICDENGENFRNMVTEETPSPLRIRFITPDDLKPSSNYRIRVVASDKDVSSAANIFPLILSGKGPTAMFESSNYVFVEGKPIDIKINLTGQSPWRLRFGIDERSAQEYQRITVSPFLINLVPLKSDIYKIFEIFDDAICPGKIIGSNTIKLELITANEELSNMDVKLFPNPTSDKITIQSDNFKNTTLQITDILGKQISQQILSKSEIILDLSNYSNGQYFLQLERDNKRIVYKIIKL